MTKKNVSSRSWFEVTLPCERVLAWSGSASRAMARPGLLVALLLVLVPLCVVLLKPASKASPVGIIVNTLDDPGNSSECSLRGAIENANSESTNSDNNCAAGTGSDTINFSVSGTITLGSALPAIENTLTIDGTGQTVTVDGDGLYQILYVNSAATLTLNDLTIADGSAPSSFGGGIYNLGTVTAANCTFSGNSAGTRAGGIYNVGTLTVTSSNFSGNSASGDNGSGGAIFNDGTLAVTNSSFSGNSATYGGGIVNYIFGTLTVVGSIFSGNSAPSGYGGGFDNAGELTVSNSTFSANSAPFGGGIYNDVFSTLTVTNSTFSRNSAQTQGGGIYSNGGGHGGTPTIINSIFADSPSGGNCYGAIGNGGHNISDDATCDFGAGTGANGQTIGDNVDPFLSASGLQNNGGPTQTIALQSNSPAIDAIPVADCPATDQRGDPRPAPGYKACDVGAYEFAGIVVNTLSDSSPPGDGLCSLREAINNANSPGTDTTGGDCVVGADTSNIVFSVTGTITLTSTLPAVANASPGSLTIDGSGQDITINGAGSYQAFSVNSGATLNLDDLTVALGSSSSGGGVHNEGTLTVTDSTFSGNSASDDGGAIDNSAALTVINSTFFSNSAGVAGGGIYNAGALTVINCTFSGNSAPSGSGGGIDNVGTATVINSILANSTSGGNCAGTITNGGYNISDDATCDFGTSAGANGDTIGDSVSDADLALAPGGLANNGGPTETIALESGSYAIAAVPLSHQCPATDQRGAARPAPGYAACDIGAFEYGGVVATPTPTPTGTTVATPTATATATATLTPTAPPSH